MEIKNIVVPQGHKDPITIIEGIAPNPLPLFNYQGCQYTALDVESFCSLVKAKGARPSAIIFADDDGFTAILDDTVTSRKQDTVTMPYTYSVQAEEWEPVLSSGGTAFALKDLIDYIKRCDAATIDGFEELLVAFKNFKYVSNVSGDFTFDNRNNYTFCVKPKGRSVSLSCSSQISRYTKTAASSSRWRSKWRSISRRQPANSRSLN